MNNTLKNSLLLLTCALLACLLVVVNYWRAMHLQNADFHMYHTGALNLLAHKNIYIATDDKHLLANLNPPLFTLLFGFIAMFNYASAMAIWNSLAIIFLSLSLWIMKKNLAWKVDSYLLILLACLLSYPLIINLYTGQMVALQMLLLVGMWALARANRQIAAGAVFGLLLALKYFFGIFFVLFVLRKNYKLCVSAILSLIFFVSLSIAVVGKSSFCSHLQVMGGIDWYTSAFNGSLLGMFMRVFGHAEKGISLWHWPQAVSIAYYSLSGVLIALVVDLSVKAKSIEGFDRAFSFSLVSMLLISPLGWVYYDLFLLLPFVYLWGSARMSIKHEIVALIVLFFVNFPLWMYHPEEINSVWIIVGPAMVPTIVLVLLAALLWKAPLHEGQSPPAFTPMQKLWLLIVVYLYPALVFLKYMQMLLQLK